MSSTHCFCYYHIYASHIFECKRRINYQTNDIDTTVLSRRLDIPISAFSFVNLFRRVFFCKLRVKTIFWFNEQSTTNSVDPSSPKGQRLNKSPPPSIPCPSRPNTIVSSELMCNVEINNKKELVISVAKR